MGDPTDGLWTEVQIECIPQGRSDRNGRRLGANWCKNHGPAYVEAILAASATLDTLLQPGHFCA